MPEMAGHVFGIPLNDVLVAASGATGLFFFFFFFLVVICFSLLK